MANKTHTEEVNQDVLKFTKEQILESSKYASYKDAVSVILSEDKTYTLDEVNKKLDNFMKGKVN